MIVLVDTNIILDILLERQPFFINSKLCLLKLIEEGDTILISSSQATGIYYILSKCLKSKDLAREAIKKISLLAEFSTVDNGCIQNALVSNIFDFEDAVVAKTAEESKADFILTRNEKDFINSLVKAISPDDFIKFTTKTHWYAEFKGIQAY